MDKWLTNFTCAIKWQTKCIFKCFFPFKPSTVASPATPSKDASQQNLPLPNKTFTHAIPILTEDGISELAKSFAEAIPEDGLQVSVKKNYHTIG